MSERKPYDVGYGKPPRGTRFQKGLSGNPRGRPKGSLNVATALERELNQRVTIKENGQTRTITKFEAAIKQLANKAASGDAKAIQFLVNLVHVSNGGALSDAPLPFSSEADRAVMATLRHRFQSETPLPRPEENPNDSKS